VQQALLEQNLATLDQLRKMEHSLKDPPPPPPEPGEQPELDLFHSNVLEAARLLEIPSNEVSHKELLTLVSTEWAKRLVSANHWCGQLESIVQSLRQTVQQHEAQAENGGFPDDQTLKNNIRYESLLDRQYHRLLYQLLGRRKNPMRFVLRDLCADSRQETPAQPQTCGLESTPEGSTIVAGG
jgi:hypothetical protein